MHRIHFVFLFVVIMIMSFLKGKNSFLIPDITISIDEKKVFFPYCFDGNTGLYFLDLESDIISEWFSPIDGFVTAPSFFSNGEQLVFVVCEKLDKKPTSIIYLYDSMRQKKKIIELSTYITNAVIMPNGKRIFFLTADFYSNSSPLIAPQFKEMNIYSVEISGGNLEKETQISAYSIRGKLFFDNEGKYLFFNYHSSDSLTQSGPYMMDIYNKKIVRLAPTNFQTLYPNKEKNKSGNNFFVDFLEPIPFEANQVLLRSPIAVYKLNINTMVAEIVYELSDYEQTLRHKIKKIAIIHSTNKILLLKELEKNKNSFCIINEKGEVEKNIVINMTKFLDKN